MTSCLWSCGTPSSGQKALIYVSLHGTDKREFKGQFELHQKFPKLEINKTSKVKELSVINCVSCFRSPTEIPNLFSSTGIISLSNVKAGETVSQLQLEASLIGPFNSVVGAFLEKSARSRKLFIVETLGRFFLSGHGAVCH